MQWNLTFIYYLYFLWIFETQKIILFPHREGCFRGKFLFKIFLSGYLKCTRLSKKTGLKCLRFSCQDTRSGRESPEKSLYVRNLILGPEIQSSTVKIQSSTCINFKKFRLYGDLKVLKLSFKTHCKRWQPC